MMLKHASLFSGIGGFDLAAEWAGWENMFHCEINPFGQKVLKYYWPNAKSYGDITKTDFTIHRGTIDVLTGGFPCQPFSLAGKRLGTEDDRNLWPEYHRAIREIQPTWVVGENVPGLLNWSGGLVFEQVQADLENEGYEVWPVILPACGVNAPHRRERIWFIAHTKREGLQKPEKDKQFIKLPDVERNNIQNDVTNPGLFRPSERQEQSMGPEQLCEEWNASNPDLPGCERPDEQEPFGWSCDTPEPSFDGENGNVANATGDRRERERKESEIETGLQQRSESTGKLEGRLERFCNDRHITDTCREQLQGSEQYRSTGSERSVKTKSRQFSRPVRSQWEQFPTQSPVLGRNDEFSNKLDGITFSKWRNESIKSYGNAIVPQVAFQIFKAINQFNETNK